MYKLPLASIAMPIGCLKRACVASAVARTGGSVAGVATLGVGCVGCVGCAGVFGSDGEDVGAGLLVCDIAAGMEGLAGLAGLVLSELPVLVGALLPPPPHAVSMTKRNDAARRLLKVTVDTDHLGLMNNSLMLCFTHHPRRQIGIL
jgi:hypothetical protein